MTKIASAEIRVDHYVFVTTEPVALEVADYAASLYRSAGGTEVVVLDCLDFVRHLLHFFHRRRIAYLEAYQELLLAEPESAVSQVLKEAFLALRRAAQADL